MAAFRSQRQWTHIFISRTTHMAMGTQLGFKRNRENHYSSQCSWKLWFRHYYLWLFLQVALYHPPPLRVLEAHLNGIMGISIHITEFKIHISYLKHNDSTLFSSIMFICHPFQPSPIPFLDHFSFSCNKITTKLSWCLIDWQLTVPNVHAHARSYPLPLLWQCDSLNVDLNEIERVIHLSVPENYSFESIISDYCYR